MEAAEQLEACHARTNRDSNIAFAPKGIDPFETVGHRAGNIGERCAAAVDHGRNDRQEQSETPAFPRELKRMKARGGQE